jgi:hypothetical protein
MKHCKQVIISNYKLTAIEGIIFRYSFRTPVIQEIRIRTCVSYLHLLTNCYRRYEYSERARQYVQ